MLDFTNRLHTIVTIQPIFPLRSVGTRYWMANLYILIYSYLHTVQYVHFI